MWRGNGRSAGRRDRGRSALDAAGRETGIAVIGMGSSGRGGVELLADVDLMLVYGAEGGEMGGTEGAENGE